ncbi:MULTISPECIES: AzlC family ABC transporter permease [Halomonadaceae]|uniref:AzlC family ABC transporter permease n=1 Tax=Halomonadaceae TaxID=28256 RepID=UPI00159ABD87|nr:MULTISPECIES: AzlC family ABC transporter permease [unclassified Halomonas]QJQ96542.1 AzlC family ABC transporter permease [Halomonas sp. PA5]
MSNDSGAWQEWCAGLRDSFSLVVGYAPIAFSFGVVAVQAGLAAWQAVLISLVVFAGASQFVMVAMLGAGSGGLAVLSAVLMMNLRHLFYGPSLALRLAKLPKRLAPLLAFGLTDEVFATAMAKGSSRRLNPLWYLGVATGAYTAWVFGTIAGAVLGALSATGEGIIAETFAFVLPALFVALLAQAFHHRLWPVVLVAGAVTLVGLLWLPGQAAMLIGMLMGALAGGMRSVPHRVDKAK